MSLHDLATALDILDRYLHAHGAACPCKDCVALAGARETLARLDTAVDCILASSRQEQEDLRALADAIAWWTDIEHKVRQAHTRLQRLLRDIQRQVRAQQEQTAEHGGRWAQLTDVLP